MKFLYFSVFFLLSVCSFGQTSNFLKFEQRVIDLGNVKKGAVIDTVFVFTNISDEKIQIDIVDACECTDLEWTEDEILPGEKGEIYVRFNSAEKEIEEEISVDITLLNNDPKTGGPVLDGVSYTYKFVN